MERSDPVILNQVTELDQYQTATSKYRVSTANPEYVVLNMLSEAGEVAGVFAKLVRGDYGVDVALEKLKKELGDVLWHVAQCARDNNWTLSEIANDNLDKLDSRAVRGVLKGSGDDR